VSSHRSVTALVALVALIGAAAGLAFATSDTRPEAAVVLTATPQFVVVCTWSHRAADDPIVHPAEAGMSHEHDFFGSVATDASSTAASLLGTDTSCQTHSADTAAYWTPTLYDDGRVVEPGRLYAYYRRPAITDLDPATIQTYPLGLAVIAGDMAASSPQPTSVVAWHCGASEAVSASPPTCPRGEPLALRVAFPPCWDGRQLDSTDHRSHLAYVVAGRCPTSHPVVLPELVVDVVYAFNGDPSRLRLASGDVRTGHADFLNAWDPDGLAQLVDGCLVREAACGTRPNRIGAAG
jgi:hypothetical protein